MLRNPSTTESLAAGGVFFVDMKKNGERMLQVEAMSGTGIS